MVFFFSLSVLFRKLLIDRSARYSSSSLLLLIPHRVRAPVSGEIYFYMGRDVCAYKRLVKKRKEKKKQGQKHFPSVSVVNDNQTERKKPIRK